MLEICLKDAPRMYRDRLKGWYVVARVFFLLLLHCSAWHCKICTPISGSLHELTSLRTLVCMNKEELYMIKVKIVMPTVVINGARVVSFRVEMVSVLFEDINQAILVILL